MNTKVPLLTLGIAAAAVAVHVFPGAAAALQLDRTQPLVGEIWRLWTAHLAHFGPSHLIWDVGTLLVLGTACERTARRRYVITIVLAAPLIGTAVWLFQPQYQTYRGLSGIDCALFGVFAALLVRQQFYGARIVGLAGLVGAIVKCVAEVTANAPVFVSTGDFAPVPLAHFMGLAIGVLVGVLGCTVRADEQQRGGYAASQRDAVDERRDDAFDCAANHLT